MPLAAAAATKKTPSDKQLVTSVEEILAGEDVQSFALSALMTRLRKPHAPVGYRFARQHVKRNLL